MDKKLNGLCKAKDLKETLAKMWLKLTRPIEMLETADFDKN